MEYLNNHIKIRKIITIIFIFVSCLLIINSVYKYSACNTHDIDGTWNATVSKNFANTGKYKTSLYRDVLFHYNISTGESTLLLQALIYKLFGINHFTTLLSVLIFALILYVMTIILITKESRLYLLGSIMLTFYLFSNNMYHFLLTHLYGELPAICYSIIAFYLLYKVFGENVNNRKKNLFCFIAGICFGLAILSKLIMVFLLVSITGILLLDLIINKNVSVKNYFIFVGGILFILLLDYLFRLIQFNFSISDANNSIKLYFKDMFQQSKYGLNFADIDNSDIITRINKLDYISKIPIISVIYLFFPLFSYIYIYITSKKINPVIYYMGVCALSAFIYYVFFGTLALDEKKLFPYFYLLLCYYLYIILILVKGILEQNKINKILKYIFCIIIIFICLSKINFNQIFCGFIDFSYNKDNQRIVEDQQIEILKSLPSDSLVVSTGLMPLINLYNDIMTIEINDSREIAKKILNNAKIYFFYGFDGVKSSMKFDEVVYLFNQMGLYLNKIQSENNNNIPIDEYGVYEIKVRDSEKLKKWNRSKIS